jgi:hypothetical protein
VGLGDGKLAPRRSSLGSRDWRQDVAAGDGDVDAGVTVLA